MGRNANRAMLESAVKNTSEYIFYRDRLKEIAMSSIRWVNLPDSIDERFLEWVLFHNGMGVFYYDEDLKDFLALKVRANGGFNVYRVPVNRTAYGDNGFNVNLTDENSVIIYNNLLRQNEVVACEMFASKIANIDRMIDVNINAQKTPILIECDEQQKLTLQNAYMKYEGNQPVIYAHKGCAEPIKAMTTGAPYVADRAYQLKLNYWNEALTYYGVSNISIDKKERLITDEVIRSQGGTIASRMGRLLAREIACKQINEMFKDKLPYGEIHVEYRADSEDGEFNGELYDPSENDM